MKRLFAGIRLPQELKDTLSRRQGGLEGARWVAPDNFHITLFYLGEVAEIEAREASLALSRVEVPPFEVTLGGEDYFGKRKPHALFTTVEKSEPLETLAAKVRQAALPFAQSKETRKFTPHVTLAYLRGLTEAPVLRHLSQQPLTSPQGFIVSSFELIESFLRDEGPLYQTLSTYPMRT